MSSNRKLPAATIGLFAVVVILHAVGTRNHLYWQFAWFDVVLHLLGGLAVGVAVIWAVDVRARRRGHRPSAAIVLTAAVVAAFLAGIAWEVWEYLTGRVFVDADGYVADTATDLALDLVGGAGSGLFTRHRSPSASLSAAPPPSEPAAD